MWDMLQVVLGLRTLALASTVLPRSAQSMHLITIESSEVVDTNHLWQNHLPLASHKFCVKVVVEAGRLCLMDFIAAA